MFTISFVHVSSSLWKNFLLPEKDSLDVCFCIEGVHCPVSKDIFISPSFLKDNSPSAQFQADSYFLITSKISFLGSDFYCHCEAISCWRIRHFL